MSRPIAPIAAELDRATEELRDLDALSGSRAHTATVRLEAHIEALHDELDDAL